MTVDTRLFLGDICHSIELIHRFIDGMSLEAFLEREMTKSAVSQKLMVIGEAARQMPDHFKYTHPNVPWDKLRRLRNHLIHEYFGVDYQMVWKFVQSGLSPIQEHIRKIQETTPELRCTDEERQY
jgi:uncharacterized protein with HEPN domain